MRRGLLLIELAYTLVLAGGLALLPAGAAKVRRPFATARALYEAGLPASMRWARILGCTEVAISIAVFLALGGVLPWLAAALGVACLYVLFAVFLGFALAFGKPLKSCGCIGSDGIPPTWLHVAVNLLVAGAGISVSLARIFDSAGEPSLSAWLLVGWLGSTAVGVLLAQQLVVRAAGATLIASRRTSRPLVQDTN